MSNDQDRNNTNAALGTAAASLSTAQRANALARGALGQAAEAAELYADEVVAHSRTRGELEKSRKEIEALKLGADAELIKRIQVLEERLDQQEKEAYEKNRVISRKDELLRQWMISQTAFKNLFKRYGVLPDGRKAGEMPDEERKDMVAKESEHIVETGDGIATEEVRKTIMGGK